MRKNRLEMLHTFGTPDPWRMELQLPHHATMQRVFARIPWTLVANPTWTEVMLEWVRFRLRHRLALDGLLLDSLRQRFRAVLDGCAWEAAFPLPWTQPAAAPLCLLFNAARDGAIGATEGAPCPDDEDQVRFRHPALLVWRSGLRLAPPAETVARALTYFCALPGPAPALPAWLWDGLLARLEGVLAGEDWEAAFPLPGRSAAPRGGLRTALPTLLLGLERWVLQQGTSHSPALPSSEALARLVAYRLTTDATVCAAFTAVKKLAQAHAAAGPADARVPTWPFHATLYPIARVTAVAICGGVSHGLSHAHRRQRMLAGLPRRAWRDRGAPRAGSAGPDSEAPWHTLSR